MERPGVMKLRWPTRSLKIELPGSLGEPSDFGQSETGILPIDFEAGVPRIGFDPVVTKHFSKLGHTFPVSGYSFRGCLMRITGDAERCVTRIVTMNCDPHVDIGYAQFHQRQFDIKLDRVNDEGINSGRLDHGGRLFLLIPPSLFPPRA